MASAVRVAGVIRVAAAAKRLPAQVTERSDLATQLSLPNAAHDPSAQALQVPAAVSEAPVKRVPPAKRFPQTVWARQLAVLVPAYVLAAQSAIESPSFNLVRPTARVSPVSWLPAAVYVAQSVRPDVTPHVPSEQSAQVPATRRVASVKRSFFVVQVSAATWSPHASCATQVVAPSFAKESAAHGLQMASAVRVAGVIRVAAPM